MPNGIYKYFFILAAFILQIFATNSLADTLPQTGWSLLSVDSQELVGENGAAVNAFDGDINTIWHTAWSSNGGTTTPHHIDIYLGGSYQLDGFRYLPRQDGDDNGRINQYEFYVSTDGINWGTPVASGNFADNALEQETLFITPETGAFIRLVALNSYDGDRWTAIAELNILGDPGSFNQAPDSSIDTPATDLVINVGDTPDFTGTGSDPDGDTSLSYLWSFGAGSGIPDATSEDPGLKQFNNEGVFTVSFTVTDSLGLADPTPAIRTITVGNQAPDGSIDAPGSDLIINVGNTLNFTATGSDPDGDTSLTYLWSFGAGSGIADATIEDPGSVQFDNAGVFTVSFTVTDSLGLADPTPDVRIITVQVASQDPIPQTGWSLLSVDSEELVAEDGAAVNAFDGNNNTIWHTQYFPSATSHPHDIQINLGGTYQLSGFRQLPRQDSVRGRIKSYEFYVSLDGINWGTSVASGTFPDSAAEQEVLFTPVQATFVRLIALSEFNGGNLTSMAELTLLGDLTTANLAPNGSIDAPATDQTINIGDSLSFTATGSDPNGNTPLTYLWNFGAGSGIPDASIEDPGPMQFNNDGVFTVSFTVTDSRGLADPTPATRVIDVCTPPSVSIIAPENKHMQTSSTLNVQAHPCLGIEHFGWGVRFTLKDSGGATVAQADDDVTPYQVAFTGLPKDEYTVEATLIDLFGFEVGGTTAQVSQIGIGVYYVAAGDSITLGLGDNILADNTSLDGRNILGGYTPILNDQLTTLKAYPHTVINRGIAGDTSIEGLLLMPSILASNPEAQYVLIQYGTNDASFLPSGLGLSAGQSGYDGSFKDNMQQMITLVANAGKQAYLAKIPFAKGSYSGRNTLIQQYNLVIDELIFENSISVAAPDFYTYFESHQTEYADDLHPNGTGYQSMANLWFIALTQNDSDDGLLRQMIADAPAGTVITFDPLLDGQTITLGGTQLLIDKDLTIDASALPNGLTINGNGASRVFEIAAGNTVTLQGLTITGGTETAANGGGIYNHGTLTLTDATLSNNTAQYGGAIYNNLTGTATLERCALIGNVAVNDGGAIYQNGTMTLTNTTISGNNATYGGGIISQNSITTTVINTTIANNNGSSGGGGFYNASALSIENSIIAGNTSSTGPDIWNNTGQGGSIIPAGANLIGDNSTATTEFPLGALVGNTASPLNPQLSVLGNYGGPTLIRLPLAGSPIIDVAIATANTPTTDQRGFARPLGAGLDIGAVESLTFAEAVDTTGLNWSGDWFGEPSATAHDGVDAARSKDITDSEMATVDTTVTGPGTVTFWWKVSSESGFDYLQFYLDAVQQPGAPQISGEVDWQQMSVPVPAGSHTLRWTYSKDGATSNGSDAGWLDQVVFTPSVVDSDGDGISDADEVLNGTNPNSVDSDGDFLVDGAGGIVSVSIYPGGIDINGDGFVDGEQDLGTDPMNSDTDGDGISDGDEILYGIDPTASNVGDLAPRGNPDNIINVGDLLVLTRLATGVIQPTALESILGDINSDSQLNAADLLLLQQAVLNGTAP